MKDPSHMIKLARLLEQPQTERTHVQKRIISHSVGLRMMAARSTIVPAQEEIYWDPKTRGKNSPPTHQGP